MAVVGPSGGLSGGATQVLRMCPHGVEGCWRVCQLLVGGNNVHNAHIAYSSWLLSQGVSTVPQGLTVRVGVTGAVNTCTIVDACGGCSVPHLH